MTDGEHKRIATDAAKEALQDFMLLLGVDVSSPAAVVELQKDFHHIRSVRLAGKAIGDKVLMVATGSAATAVFSALGYYVLHHA